MEYRYKTKGGVCSREIDVTIENGVITNVCFHGGCNGNTQGITRLAIGMKPEDVVARLRGIKCGWKESSCPDQLAQAIEELLKSEKKTD